jgi:hypothetical protein
MATIVGENLGQKNVIASIYSYTEAGLCSSLLPPKAPSIGGKNYSKECALTVKARAKGLQSFATVSTYCPRGFNPKRI